MEGPSYLMMESEDLCLLDSGGRGHGDNRIKLLKANA